MLKADFNCKLMFGKINKYVVLRAEFNCKLMFGKINFILPNIYFTKVYSTKLFNICACQIYSNLFVNIRSWKMCAFISCCLPNFFLAFAKLIFYRCFEQWPTTWNFSTLPSTSMSSAFAGRQWHDGRVDGPDQHNNIMDTGDCSQLYSSWPLQI